MLTESTFTIERNKFNIRGRKWIPQKEIIAAVQISHGMAEHIGRYSRFAQQLAKEGFAVYGNDHRGHGSVIDKENIRGYFSKEDGFENVTDDLFAVTKLIQQEHPRQPVFLLGHSMGSFLARRYIQKYGDELAGVILSGTSGNPGLLGAAGIMISRFESKRLGEKTPSSRMNTLTFGSYNKKFRRHARTEFDWLTRDEDEVDRYLNDPDCGGIFTSGFFEDLLYGLKTINLKSNLEQMPKNLPVLLISGEEDPVGNFGKGVKQAYRSYVQAGMKDVELKLYPGARHELLNEVNKEEIDQDILSWILKRI
ncbi:alpha/beta fold hydrolase [Bacillus lacus]|uniref:Alpha/beta fold hydrolase n=1 Tax=Metabacillus lacus TaxID=1983721 RepID=A0A7X2J2B1_9BACI|nr:alpha/beta hydrolase [Metabacillus lacus]MRX74178.1 alpha/beta fold hydrolase [Metabacillus lacus]